MAPVDKRKGENANIAALYRTNYNKEKNMNGRFGEREIGGAGACPGGVTASLKRLKWGRKSNTYVLTEAIMKANLSAKAKLLSRKGKESDIAG